MAEAVREALARPFARDDSALLLKELGSAQSLLIIGDNAGETVFDRLLLEEIRDRLGPREVT